MDEAQPKKRQKVSSPAGEAFDTASVAEPSAGIKEWRIHVGGLPFLMEEIQLKEHFGKCGDIVCAQLLKTPLGKSRGIAFVTFSDKSGFKAALKLDGVDCSGRCLKVSKAEGVGRRDKVRSSLDAAGIVRRKGSRKFKGPSEVGKGNFRIFVGCLPYEADEAAIKLKFEKYGEVACLRMPVNKKGRCKGFAFITYTTLEAMTKALKRNGKEYGGRTLDIRTAGAEAPLKSDAVDEDWSKDMSSATHTDVGKGNVEFRQAREVKGKGKGKAESARDFEVFVGGLPYDSDEVAVRKDFGEFGDIGRFSMPLDDEGYSKGIAFINYKTNEGMEKVLKCDGEEYNGMRIRVQRANAPKGGGCATDDVAKSTGKPKPLDSHIRPQYAIVEATGKRQTFADSDEE